jgi:hypothetical protein
MPRVLSSNVIVMDILDKYPGLFVDSNHGILAGGITLMLELENISPGLKSDITQKLLVFLNTSIRTQLNKGKTNGSEEDTDRPSSKGQSN